MEMRSPQQERRKKPTKRPNSDMIENDKNGLESSLDPESADEVDYLKTQDSHSEDSMYDI